MLSVKNVLITLSSLVAVLMLGNSTYAESVPPPSVNFEILNILSDDATVQVDEVFEVDLVINYANGLGTTLSDLDFTLNFNQGGEKLLEYVDISSSYIGTFGGTAIDNGNSVHIDTSNLLLPSPTLADPFVTLTFRALGLGPGDFLIQENSVTFTDSSGLPSNQYLSTFDGSYQVVPVPAAAWLLGSGLVGLTLIRRRKN